MCGIYGRVGKGDPAALRYLATLSQDRGTDAAGIVWRENGNFLYARRPGAARKLIRRLGPKVLKADIVVGHTRQATNGSPSCDVNNHPFVGKRWIVVHNGFVFNANSFPRKGECDSEAILSALEKQHSGGGKAIRRISKKLTGMFACAAIDLCQPDYVYLWRDFQPMWLGQLQEATIFASDSHYIRKAYPKASITCLAPYTIAKVGQYGIVRTWNLPSSAVIYRWPDDDWFPGETTEFLKETRFTPSGNDPLAWYSEHSFAIFCPTCASLASDEWNTELHAIYGTQHWLLKDNKFCECCGDPLY